MYPLARDDVNVVADQVERRAMRPHGLDSFLGGLGVFGIASQGRQDAKFQAERGRAGGGRHRSFAARHAAAQIYRAVWHPRW